MDPAKAKELLESNRTLKDWRDWYVRTLNSSDKAVLRALVAVYNNQMEDEKKSRMSLHENGIGFNKIDANRLTKWAELARIGYYGFSSEEVSIIRSFMYKYWRQVVDISKANCKKAVEEAEKNEAEVGYEEDETGQLRMVLNDA